MQITTSKTANILLFPQSVPNKDEPIAWFHELQIHFLSADIPLLCDNQNPIAGCDRPFLYNP